MTHLIDDVTTHGPTLVNRDNTTEGDIVLMKEYAKKFVGDIPVKVMESSGKTFRDMAELKLPYLCEEDPCEWVLTWFDDAGRSQSIQFVIDENC